MPTDLEKIDELHHADMRASKNQDYRTLRSLLSDDAVILPPGGRIIRGREALDKNFEALSDAPKLTEVLDYRFDWHEVRVFGEFAFEWGYIVGSERNRKTGATTSEKYHVMRILQRQHSGAWKVHRTIWNAPG